MNRIFLKVILLIFCPLWLIAEIIETDHFEELVQYVTKDSLVLLDIDDTLLIPAQTLGTDAWFLYRIQQHEEQGKDHHTALEKALAEWEAIRHLTEVKIVEKGSQQIVENLQKQKIPVMGLTTQGLALATRTVMQLKTLGIDLTLSAPSEKSFYYDNHFSGDLCLQTGVLYRQGILFTSGTNKGEALLKLFDRMKILPQHVVFINDKATHLKDVQKAMEKAGIAFTGLRYAYSDARVNSFKKEIADIQWMHSNLHYLLSDAEAEKILLFDE